MSTTLTLTSAQRERTDIYAGYSAIVRPNFRVVWNLFLEVAYCRCLKIKYIKIYSDNISNRDNKNERPHHWHGPQNNHHKPSAQIFRFLSGSVCQYHICTGILLHIDKVRRGLFLWYINYGYFCQDTCVKDWQPFILFSLINGTFIVNLT